MNEQNFTSLVKQLVCEYSNDHNPDDQRIQIGDVFIVWECKTLQNNKALASTTLYDGMYYEITYNGDEDEIYFDVYKKCNNRRISLGGN